MCFVMFQATFAIIAAALISGALVDRMKFGACLAFITLWSIFVYSPVAHWVWMRPAGCSIWVRWILRVARWFTSTRVYRRWWRQNCSARLQSTRNSAIPHNIPFVLLGAGLLWFGWFGFNAAAP